jgi:phosphoribosylaminoimidazolecarboxamide formyltransferase/IMP cyclohydrolase
MIRAAAKNFPGVVVLTDPADYAFALEELRTVRCRASADEPSPPKRLRIRPPMTRWWRSTYAIRTNGRKRSPSQLTGTDPSLRRKPAATGGCLSAIRGGSPTPGVLDATQLAGKELSFNNLLDADAAWSAIQGFAGPAVAIVKHTIPCGLSTRDDLATAFREALRGDPVSAFGGIVALNRPVDGETARCMAEIVFEVVIAPGFDNEAIETLGRKKALRLLEMPSYPLAMLPRRTGM